jgi:hypothetical protein
MVLPNLYIHGPVSLGYNVECDAATVDYDLLNNTSLSGQYFPPTINAYEGKYIV